MSGTGPTGDLRTATSRVVPGVPPVEPIAPGRLPPWGAVRPLLVLGLLVVSLISWRSGTYYAGGVDPVVLAKAVLAGLALVLAWAWATPGTAHRLSPRTVLLVLGYVAVGLLGAAAGGTLGASAVLSVRVLMVLATVVLLVGTYPAAVLIRSLSAATGTVGVVLAASGMPAFLTGTGPPITEGRLGGALVPTSPNQLALLLGPSVLVLLWRVSRSQARLWHVVSIAVLVVLTLLTGSRASLLGLVVAAVVLVLLAPRMNLGAFASVVVLAPAAFFLVAFTGLVGGFLVRGDQNTVTTLNSRTIAWQAAFSQGRDFFSELFGGGLAIKVVSVTTRYWDTQVLDSTWVSAFVQAGVVGVLVLVVFAVGTLVLAARDRSAYGRLWLAMTAYAVVRSLFENGLLDTYVLFVVMLVPSLVLDRRYRAGEGETDQQEQPAAEQ